MLKNLPYAWGFLIACFGVTGSISASLHPLNSDEGILLSGAWHLLQGRNLYEDSFEYVAPGSYYLIAWGWKLTGSANYAVAKILAVFAAALASLAAVSTARLLAGSRVSLLPAIVYFAALNGGPLINHNPLFVLPAAWSLHFAVSSLLRDLARDRILSGLLCGISILFLQHKGLALAFALGTGLFLTSPGGARQGVKASITFALAVLAPLLLLLQWDTATLIESLVIFPSKQYLAIQDVGIEYWWVAVLILVWVFLRLSSAPGKSADGTRMATHPPSVDPHGYWVYGPWPGFGNRSETAKALLLLGLVQAALLLTAFQRPDSHHLIVILFPLIAIFPLFLKTFSLSAPHPVLADRMATMGSAAISGGLVFFALALFSAYAFHAAKSSVFRQELLGAVADHCSQSRYLYAGPFIPGLYFETGKLNATRYSLLLEKFNTAPQFAEAMSAIEAQRPGCVVLLDQIALQFGHTGNNPVEKLLRREYVPAGKVRNAIIMALPGGQ